MQTPMMTPRSAPAEKSKGKKRSADEIGSLTSDYERFAKRFNLLRLGTNDNGEHQNSSYYINVPRPQSPAPPPKTRAVKATATTNTSEDGFMEVDESRDRIFIHNLDDELADIESSDDEDRLIFLPDIEKQFSKIPQHVLTDGQKDDHESQELVLYTVPTSLTAEEGSDSVRKAILEARQRAREKAAEDARQLDMNCKYEPGDQEPMETAHGYSGYAMEQSQEPEPDPDAMDMD